MPLAQVRSGTRGPAPAEPMGVHTLGDQGRQHFPQLVGDLERAGGGDWFWWQAQHASYEAAWGLSLWSLPQSSRNPNFASPNG